MTKFFSRLSVLTLVISLNLSSSRWFFVLRSFLPLYFNSRFSLSSSSVVLVLLFCFVLSVFWLSVGDQSISLGPESCLSWWGCWWPDGHCLPRLGPGTRLPDMKGWRGEIPAGGRQSGRIHCSKHNHGREVLILGITVRVVESKDLRIWRTDDLLWA